MTEPTKRPTGAAVGAAVSPFIGLPLTFAFLLITVGLGVDSEYGGPFGAVSSAWAEGGWGMYLIVGAGGVFSLLAAMLMFFGVQRGSAAVLANAPLASALVAVGSFGYWNGMNGAIAAIAGAHPADRATILAGATGEALNTTLFGLCAMSGLLGALIPGLLLGVIAQTGMARRLLLIAMGVFGSLMLVSWALARRLAELMGSFKAVAHASPADRLTILVGVGEELERYRLFVLAPLGLLLVVVAGGAALLKSSPKLAVAVPLLGLGGLFGFGSQAFVEQRVRASAATLASKPLGLVALEGANTYAPDRCVQTSALLECDADGFKDAISREVLVDELEAGVRLEDPDDGDSEPRVRLGLARGAQAAATWEFLTTAARARVRRVALVGEGTPRKVRLPAEIEVVATALDGQFRMVAIGLAPEGSGCGQSCTRATVEGDALVVDGQKWTATSIDRWGGRLEKQVAVTVNPALEPETLVKLAMAAVANDRRLVVLFPDAVFTRVEESEDEEAAQGSDREKVTSLMAKMFGGDAEALSGLSKDQLQRVVKKHVKEMSDCYERALVKNPSLMGKIVLSWNVEKDGSVAEVEVDSNTLKDPEVTRCLSSRPATWKFPKPADGEPVRVSYPFVFSPAQ